VKVKQGHLRPEHPPDLGDTWTWAAIDRASRLAVAFYVGKRDEQSAAVFIGDLRARLVTMPQITSDGLMMYPQAIARAFGPGVDFAMTIKSWNTSRRRPSGTPSGGLTKTAVLGSPDLGMATTAHQERLNLTMRHANGRLRRRCLAFSKSLASHRAAAAIAYAHYNLCHVVRTLKKTPAERAGITDHCWTLEEFMDAVLSARPCAPPLPQPLRPRARPSPSTATAAGAVPVGARGRSSAQLDLLSWHPAPAGGTTALGDLPAPAPSAVEPPVPAPPAAPAVVESSDAQLDLLSWRPRPRPVPEQLDLFGPRGRAL
jgi:IS1 family transposase